MSHTIIVLARIDLVSLYVRLLLYHSILRGSIDQKHAKTNKIWRQNSEIHSAFASSQLASKMSQSFQTIWHMREAWNRETYSMFGLSLFRLSRLSNMSKDSNIPSPGRTRSSNALPQGQQSQSNPHPLLWPHPPRRLYIDRCISVSVENLVKWVVFWKAFVDNVQKFSSKVSSDVWVERRVVPCDVSCSFSFVFQSFLLWRVVC